VGRNKRSWRPDAECAWLPSAEANSQLAEFCARNYADTWHDVPARVIESVAMNSGMDCSLTERQKIGSRRVEIAGHFQKLEFATTHGILLLSPAPRCCSGVLNILNNLNSVVRPRRITRRDVRPVTVQRFRPNSHRAIPIAVKTTAKPLHATSWSNAFSPGSNGKLHPCPLGIIISTTSSASFSQPALLSSSDNF
jgi:hypothetical protein